MHWIQETRVKYGIQQIKLSTFLRVSRSVISLAELNQRDLPTKVMLPLAPLLTKDEVALSDNTSEKVQAIVNGDSIETNCLKQKLYRDSEIKLLRAERK